PRRAGSSSPPSPSNSADLTTRRGAHVRRLRREAAVRHRVARERDRLAARRAWARTPRAGQVGQRGGGQRGDLGVALHAETTEHEACRRQARGITYGRVSPVTSRKSLAVVVPAPVFGDVGRPTGRDT